MVQVWTAENTFFSAVHTCTIVHVTTTLIHVVSSRARLHLTDWLSVHLFCFPISPYGNSGGDCLFNSALFTGISCLSETPTSTWLQRVIWTYLMILDHVSLVTGLSWIGVYNPLDIIWTRARGQFICLAQRESVGEIELGPREAKSNWKILSRAFLE